jgi:hypothetical protein
VFNTYSQGEEIHYAAWPPVTPFHDGHTPYSMSGEGKKLSMPLNALAQTKT